MGDAGPVLLLVHGNSSGNPYLPLSAWEWNVVGERERNFHRHASSSRDDIIGRLGRRRHVFNHGILLSSSTQFSIMLGGLFGRICRCSKSSPLESQQISSTRISRCSRPSRKVTSHRAQMLPKSRERRSQQQIDGHGDSTRQYKMHLDDIVR